METLGKSNTAQCLGVTWLRALAVMVLLVAGGVQAQTSNSASYTYSFSNVVPSFEAPSVNAGYIDNVASPAYVANTVTTPLYNQPSTDHLSWKQVCGDAVNGDDDSSGPIAFPAGFQFTFGNPAVAYTAFRVGTNGSIQFSATDQKYAPIYTPSPLPYLSNGGASCANTAPTNVLYAYWTDLTIAPYAVNGVNGPVRFEMLGTAPNRRFIVSWINTRLYSNGGALFSFQIVLFESASGIPGDFEYRYLGGVTNGLGTTIGVQVNGTDWFSYNPSTNNTAANAPIDVTTGTSVHWSPITKASQLMASYQFDDASYNGTAGEVIDVSGLNQHAVAVGGVTTALANATCSASNRVLNFPSALAATARVQTPVALGSTGSVDFFYSRTTAWNDGVAAMLFDASVASAPFYLIKTTTGALQLTASPNAASAAITATTAAQAVAANTMKHIGVSWVFLPGLNQTYIQVFLDGVMVLNKRFTYNVAPYPNPISSWFNSTRTISIGGSATAVAGVSGPNGWIDNFRIYSQQINTYISTADMSCTALVDHLEISANPTTNLNPCSDATLTVKACKNAACTLTYNNGLTGTLTATPSASVVWGAGSGNFATGGAGTASVTLQVTAASTNTTMGLAGGVNPPPANATVCTFGSNAPTNNDCILTVSSNMGACVADFNCVETVANAAVAADSNPSTGRLYTKLAGMAFSFDVVARKSDGTVSTGYASGGATPVTVALVDGTTTPAACVTTLTVLSPAVTSQTLTFAAADLGRKSISFTVPSAYPSVRCRVTDNNTATLKGCSQDNFAIRPPALTLNTTASAAPPPSGTAATNVPIVKAGANFTLYPSNAANQGTNYTGTLTQDATKLTAQTTAQVTSQASGGAVGALTPASLAANPASAPANNATYSEVGYLYLAAGAFYNNTYTAVDGATDCVAGSFSDTLASGKYGCNIGTAAASLGRFVPDHFDTTITQVAGVPMACPTYPAVLTCPTAYNGFIYSGQALSVTATAKNGLATPATTVNYQGSFAKAVTLTAWDGKGSTTTSNPPGAPNAGTPANFSVTAASFASGVATVNNSTYKFATAATSPVDIYIRAIDADAVSSLRATPANSVEGGVKVVSGRIKVNNGYGSELLALSLDAAVQYYTGTVWALSTTDSVTTLTLPATFAITPSGTTAATMTPASGTIASGRITINLAKPSAGAGSATILPTAPLFLLTGNNSLGVSPSVSGLATFGVYKSPLIYRRENY